jgi:hypothetical protein
VPVARVTVTVTVSNICEPVHHTKTALFFHSYWSIANFYEEDCMPEIRSEPVIFFSVSHEIEIYFISSLHISNFNNIILSK